MDRKPKVVFQLDTPFTTTTWPLVSPRAHDIILDALCEFLAPIGEYQAKKRPASKGKRNLKRKKEVVESQDVSLHDASPVCELASFVHVGLSSVLRSLESSIQRDRLRQAAANPPDPGPSDDDAEPEPKEQISGAEDEPLLTAVFVFASFSPLLLHAHLPELVGLASLNRKLPAIRLVQLTKNAHERVCEALDMHRLSCIGVLQGAPNSQALLERLQAEIPLVEIPWLTETGTHLPLKVNVIETTQPVAKKQKGAPQATIHSSHSK